MSAIVRRTVTMSLIAMVLMSCGNPSATLRAEPVRERLAWQPPASYLPDSTPLPAAAQFRLGRPFPGGTGPNATTYGCVSATDGKTGLLFHSHLWNLETGKYLGSLRGHDTQIMFAAFSPDGSLIAGGGFDKKVCFWNAKTGEALGEPFPLSGHGYAVAFSPDGKRLAVGSTTMHLFDVVRHKPIDLEFAEADRSRYYSKIGWSPDGKLIVGLAVDPTDKFIRVWDADSGAIVRTIDSGFVHTFEPSDWNPKSQYVFSASGRYLMGSGCLGNGPAKTRRTWEIATGQLVNEQQLSGPLFFPRDGPRMTRWDQDGLMIADTQGRDLQRVRLPRDTHALMHMTSDGKRVVIFGFGGSVRLWDTETDKESRVLVNKSSPALRLSYTNDGTGLRSFHHDASVHEWDPAAGTEIRWARCKPHSEQIDGTTASLGHRLLVTVTDDHEVILWDMTTGTEKVRLDKKLASVGIKRFDGQNWFESHAWDVPPRLTDDSKYGLGLTGDEGETVTIWDACTGKSLHAVRHLWGVGSFTLTPDGDTLITGGSRVRCWDLKTGKETRAWKTSPAPRRPGWLAGSTDVPGLFLLPDAKTLAVLERQKYQTPPARKHRKESVTFTQVRLVDLTGEEKAERVFATGNTPVISFSPDGQSMACIVDRAVRLYDLITGKTYEALSTQDGVTALAFRPDSKQLATAGWDGTILLWDVTKLREKPVVLKDPPLAEDPPPVADRPPAEDQEVATRDDPRSDERPRAGLATAFVAAVCGVGLSLVTVMWLVVRRRSARNFDTTMTQ